MIRLTKPSVGKQDRNAVDNVLKTGYLVQGENVSAFENELATYVGAKHVVVMNNCTSALLLSLIALGVGKDDVVPVSAYSWIASANVIEFLGAKPYFVDIQPDTFNMDPNYLEESLRRLTSKARIQKQSIKVIMPVHAFGQLADMETISRIAKTYEVKVIEDAACALGAKYAGISAGKWGATGCFSFHPRKTITTGEGGAVTTNDSQVDTVLRALRNHGQSPSAVRPDFILPGINCRLTDFQAAMGRTQLVKFNTLLKKRRSLAKQYNMLLENTAIQTPVEAKDGYHSYQSYIVLLPYELSNSRDMIISKLKEKGVETTIGTCHMPMTTFYRRKYGFRSGDFPVTDRVHSCSLTLPMFTEMTKDNQEEVVQKLMECVFNA